MKITHDSDDDGTKVFAHLDGIYKVTSMFTIQGGFGNATMKVDVNGSTVHSALKFIHSSVDPLDCSTIYIGSVSSGSFITTSVIGDGTHNTSIEQGSVMVIERLA